MKKTWLFLLLVSPVSMAEKIDIKPVDFSYRSASEIPALGGEIRLALDFTQPSSHLLEVDRAATLQSIVVTLKGKPISHDAIEYRQFDDCLFRESSRYSTEPKDGRIELKLGDINGSGGDKVKLKGALRLRIGEEKFRSRSSGLVKADKGEHFRLGLVNFTIEEINDDGIKFETDRDYSGQPKLRFQAADGSQLKTSRSVTSTEIINSDARYFVTYHFDTPVDAFIIWSKVNINRGKVIDVPFELDLILPY